MIPCQQNYKLVPEGDGTFFVHKKVLFYWAPLTIHDIHIGHGGTIVGLLRFDRRSAQKLIRVLKWVNYNDSIIHWKFMDEIEDRFDIHFLYETIDEKFFL